jgi:hypothetical protein
MQVLLVVTALVLVATFVWRRSAAHLTSKSRRTPTHRLLGGPRAGVSSVFAGLPTDLDPRAVRAPRAAPRTTAVRATLRLVGLDWSAVSLDDLPFTLLGITREAPEVFTSVPRGKHRVRIGFAEGAMRTTKPSIDFVVDDECDVIVSRNEEGALTVERLPSSGDEPKHACCIHYPTWAKGPLVGRRFGRSPVLFDDLLDEIDQALGARRTREHLAELGDRMVGLPLTSEQLATLRKVVASHLEQASDAGEARPPGAAASELEELIAVVLPPEQVVQKV